MKTRPLILLLLASTLQPTALRAEEVTVTGAAGTAGITHTNSQGIIPGSSGGSGGGGAAATAVANTPGQALNKAVATGGTGGPGGGGGPGQDNPFIAPGFGGGGGTGAPATATATANRSNTGGGDVEASAIAEGGSGGPWGYGGESPQRDGATGVGAGSTATASAVTTNGKVKSYAWASNAGGVSGGSSIAAATGSNTSNSDVNVSATADGGPGRTSNRFAGTAGFGASLGTVNGSSTGGGSVNVLGFIRGGSGGSGPIQGGTGASASLTNAVGGSTTGLLDLYQQVSGGSGGTGYLNFNNAAGSGGAAGSATSSLSYTSTTASRLRLYVDATGGGGGEASGGTAGAAAPATAEVHATGAKDVEASVNAVGGGGNFNTSAVSSPGAVGTVNPSSAVSTGTGKTVRLDAAQGGGGGGGHNIYNSTNGGDGADSTMTDIVSGSAPAGTLTLWQTAYGGGGGSAPTGVGGRGGDAQSTLTFTHSGENELFTNVRAYGLDSGWGGSTNRASSRGGHATAASSVQDSGDVTLSVDARGGAGNLGGNASATGSGRATGAGKASVAVEAYGGPAQSNDLNATPGTTSLTGYGESVSGEVTVSGTGTAGGALAGGGHYPSRVTGRSLTLSNAVTGRTAGMLHLYQTAKGGLGTADLLDSNGSAGAGGNATSSLVLPGGNPGGGALDGSAQASGGTSQISYETQTTGAPGTATALCDLRNYGDVRADATAYAGGAGLDGFTSVPTAYGAAHATAKAVCTKPNGSALASASIGDCTPATSSPLSVTAETQGGHVTALKATATKPPVYNAGLSAGVGMGAVGIFGSAGINGIGMPLSFPSLSGTPNAAVALDGMTPLAQIDANSSNFTNGSVALTLNTTAYTGTVKMALLSVTLQNPSAPLTSFQFTVSRGATQVVTQTFTTWTAAQTWFTDRVINLGSAAAVNGQEVTVSFTFTGISNTNQAGFYPSLVIGAKTTLRTWAESYGIDPWQDLGTHDADNDGLPDILEWACNLNPNASSPLPATATRNGNTFEYLYTRSTAAVNAGAAFIVEWNDTLSANDWQTTGVTEAILSNNGTVQQVKATIPAGSSGGRFVRLRVAGPP